VAYDPHDPEWWRAVLQPYASHMEVAYEQYCRGIRDLDENERLNLDDAIARATHRGGTFAAAAAILLDSALYRVEGEERFMPDRSEWAVRRMQYRDRRLGVKGKRQVATRFNGEQNPRPPLHEQARRASLFLLGKVVKTVARPRRGEVQIEFADGSELRLGATPVGLDIEIKTDVATYTEGDHPEQTVM